MSDMTVAKTIYNQIQAIDPCAMFAWGAKNLVGDDNSLRFKTSGMVKNKGVVVIKLNSMDLYNVTFGKVRVGKYTEKARVDDVFVEDLVRVIDDMVG